MAGGFSIPFLADVGKFIKGTDSMADALDEVADSVKDLAKSSERDASRAGDKLGDGFKDGSKVAVKSLDTVDSGLKDTATAAAVLDDKAAAAFRNIAADAKKAGDKVGKESKDGFKQGSEATETFKDEAKSNLSEVASSFSGDMDSAVDLVQGTLGGLVADLGPAGLIGGAVAALAIGLAKAVADGEAERVNRIGDAVSQLSGEIEAVGGDLSRVDFDGRMREWGLSIQDTKEWWELWQSTALTGAEKIERQARDAGLGFKDMFRGVTGDSEAAHKALKQIDTVLEDLKKKRETIVDPMSGIATTTGTVEVEKRIRALEDLKKQVSENITIQDEAAHVSELMAKADVATADTTDQLKEATDKANAALEAKAALMEEAGSSAMDAVTAEIAYNDAMAQGAKDIAANGKGLDLHTAVGKANQQTLIDMAQASNDLRDKQIAQGDSTDVVAAKAGEARDKFIAAATAAGANAAEAQALADKYGLIPGNVDTYVKAHNVQKTKDEIDGVAAPREVPVNLTPYVNPSYFQRVLASMSNQEIPVMLRPRTGSPLP